MHPYVNCNEEEETAFHIITIKQVALESWRMNSLVNTNPQQASTMKNLII